MAMSQSPAPLHAQTPDNDRTSLELRALDCNLASLCDHILLEGFNSGAFSDVAVQAMGSTYRLHRLVLSRSSYFRNMLQGPWKEAGAPTLVLYIDDASVNSEAIAITLAYLYGHHPELNDSNAFRVLAAASFLDLQDLCAICTDFIISDLWTTNFLAYQVLPKLSSQTLHALLTSDELWVPNEEKRFELALYTLLAKGALPETDNAEQEVSFEGGASTADSSVYKGKSMTHYGRQNQLIESEFQSLRIHNLDGYKAAAQNIVFELADGAVELPTDTSHLKSLQEGQMACTQSMPDSRYPFKMERPVTLTSLEDSSVPGACSSYVELRNNTQEAGVGSSYTVEGPSGESSCYNDIWLSRDESSKCSSAGSINGVMDNDWGRSSMPPLWGGRIVGKWQVKSAKEILSLHGEEYDAFLNIFEGGSLLYCNMSFEALLNVRKQLEELGFPCKAVNDGLWLQMLLCQRVQEIGADTCKKCCFTKIACTCRHPYGYSHGGTSTGYYRQEYDRNTGTSGTGNVNLSDGQGEGGCLYESLRVNVGGPIDGLAGIGRGTTFVSAAAWPPTRYVFSRVPYGMGNWNGQQSIANGESEARNDFNGDPPADGLTALVELSHGRHVGHAHREQLDRVNESDIQNRLVGASVLPSAIGVPLQMSESQEHALGLDWETPEGSSISLDMKTPLRHFPPFRFGVEFEDVHRLSDGQVKHSPEVLYAGSLWKVSVQAFSDEDPQGRRTLGLFLHRRKAETTDFLRKVHVYVDSREKVTARYQLICSSKREVMVFGSFKQAGTLLPKAPKGWGWRTALLFDELAELLQGGSLRVSAVVQLV